MQEKAVRHTVDILERLYTQVRFVIPADMREQMEHALDHVQGNGTLTLEEAEDTLIVFGKRVWPYRKAFEDFLSVEENHRAEEVFLAKLSIPLKKRYRMFIEQGGSFADIHTGNNMRFFTSDERMALCEIWIEVKKDMRAAVIQAVHSTEKKRFDRRVREFTKIFEDIEKELETLEQMADKEQEHPHLAAEIRSHIKGFEYGLCLLGPEADYAAVCQAAEHFAGRKGELRVFV